MNQPIRIGTRESQLAVWQATKVQSMLQAQGIEATLVFIKSDGDTDLKTPLYEIGVQGIFTRSLDLALLSNQIDIAVHSMKDVPTQLAKGIAQAAVLERANHKDILVLNGDAAEIAQQLGYDGFLWNDNPINELPFTIGTSSIRRKAQWLNRYPHHQIENLRGNVNTRLKKVAESQWQGAIFAAAGLERIDLRPDTAIDLDWMLPAPAQGAIMVVCKEDNQYCLDALAPLNDANTAMCTAAERDFLRALLGGCSTPISALASIKNDKLILSGSILSPDGRQKAAITLTSPVNKYNGLGKNAAIQLLEEGGQAILDQLNHG